MISKIQDKRTAIVCDWISDWWWAELVLEHMLELFPNADIFTSVFWQQWNSSFEWKRITTSFIQKIPILNKSHKLALTLRPLAFESFDMSSYDIVISSSSAESKWVITKPDCLHICYCHTPTRYFWSHYTQYLKMMEFGILNVLWKWAFPKIINKLKRWDFCAAQRPDIFIANSKNTQERIKKYYQRDSIVVYPWIETQQFHLPKDKKDFYLAVGRCIPYKKFDLLVETFNKNGKTLVIITNTENKLYRELKKKSKENIVWKLWVPRKELYTYYADAKCFLFPPEEDFGIVPLEAMASGTPVIAYKKWGALETVRQWKTGVFFEEQTPLSLQKAIDEFESMTFDMKILRDHAKGFDKEVFQESIWTLIQETLKS